MKFENYLEFDAQKVTECRLCWTLDWLGHIHMDSWRRIKVLKVNTLSFITRNIPSSNLILADIISHECTEVT